VAPARDVGGLSWPAPRAAAVARVGLGLQRDVGRVRLRGGIGATALWLPPAALVDRPLRTAPGPDEAGWFALALGPEAGLGLPFGRGLALGVDLGAHGAWLDVDGDGRARLGAVPSVAVGVELAP
jgi:hypothetical protein